MVALPVRSPSQEAEGSGNQETSVAMPCPVLAYVT